MNRTLLGALAALILAAVGLFWWQGRAATDMGEALPQLAGEVPVDGLPGETGAGQRGAAPPEVSEASKEQRRFDRLDKDRDSKITRTEALTPRVAMFRKLDTDGNNLLSFEEWAVKTSNRFKGADKNGDGKLDRPEFATTKPLRKPQLDCKCGPPLARAAAQKRGPAVRPAPDLLDEDFLPAE